MSKIAVCLSGGGSRAIAFHLGCLRSLEKHGILNDVKCISSISGGSVINGMYSYSEESFEEFEQRVVGVLKEGLKSSIAANYVVHELLGSFFNNILIFLFFCINKIFKTSFFIPKHFSMTKGLAKKLNTTLRDKELSSSTRNGIEAIFNATNVDDGTAFRFSNLEVTSWKNNKSHGEIINSFKLAEAVTASAAFPLLLAPLDLNIEFNSGTKKWVSLTDGGVYENLGITPLFFRHRKVGYSPVNPDYIFAFDAETESFDSKGNRSLFGRLGRCVEVTMRRVRSMNFKVLNDLKADGRIKGFVLTTLNQDDSAYENLYLDSISREQVNKYPTNFSPMSVDDIELLSRRGEELTDNFISLHVPELIKKD
ncbi:MULTISPECIES: patatin-like phospholipase family protein [unclassified Halobacteriovorax]|uniref:patatin-like phospholipase family protein n=1 Tax=unclassified Halobacteriovorax TaxID=2639665 RepID=UPI00399993B3